MTDVTRYPHGAPSWLELATADVPAAAEFYSGLFGWSTQPREWDSSADRRIFTVRDLPICGVHEHHGLPTWTIYLAVRSIDEATAAATAAGGELLTEPETMPGAGSMALVRDPAGARVGMWEAGEQPGTQLVNEAGAPAWHELASRDPQAAAAFYQKVFGWIAQPVAERGADYTMWQVEGTPVCGMLAMDEAWDATTPSHWMPYFATLDTDATVAHAVELGGHAEGSPADSPHGRFATLRDPQGAQFSVIRSTV
jgi:predicted enzyme related to lactoylglutathione lyase